jgi:DNA-binding MarR family transcriptional regulator
MGGDLSMHTEIIEDLKITVSLPKKVLQNLERAGYLDNYTDYSGDLTITSYASRRTLNKTVADMIIREWK